MCNFKLINQINNIKVKFSKSMTLQESILEIKCKKQAEWTLSLIAKKWKPLAIKI